MSKQLLIERFSMKDMKYIAESNENSRYLGRFEGIAADFLHPTRNGRRYPLELWENVAKSPDFIEAMETKTLYGEADHPEERLETLITEAAICLRSFEIRKDEGVVWCSFDILDTPRGRILKSLLDYGSKIGVSSRGSGEEIIRDGETIIDPDTYLFICFDAVIMPAVKSARQSVTESVDIAKAKNLTESVKSEIQKAKTPAELNSIKSIINALDVPELDSLNESINIQLEKLGSGEDISTSLMTDLDESLKQNKELKEEIKTLKSERSARNTRVKEMRSLISKMNGSEKKLRRLLNDTKREKASLEESIIESANQCDEFEKSLNSSRARIQKLQNEISTLRRKNLQLENKVQELNQLRRKFNSSVKESSLKAQELSDLQKKNRFLAEKLVSSKNESKSKLDQEKKLTEQVNKLSRRLDISNKNFKDATESYLRLASSESGFSIATIKNNLKKDYNISDINKVVTELKERKDRLSKMPIEINSGIEVAFSKQSAPDSQEIAQTKSILRSIAQNSNN